MAREVWPWQWKPWGIITVICNKPQIWKCIYAIQLLLQSFLPFCLGMYGTSSVYLFFWRWSLTEMYASVCSMKGRIQYPLLSPPRCMKLTAFSILITLRCCCILPVIHEVHCRSIYAPSYMDWQKTKYQPSQKDFKNWYFHVVALPLVQKLCTIRHKIIQELEKIL